MAHGQGGAEIGIDHGPTLTCNHEAPIVAHSLRAEGFDASEDGTGRGAHIVPVAFNARQDPDVYGGCTDPIDTDGSIHAVAFSCKDYGADAADGVAPTMRAMGHGESHANAGGQLAVAFDLNQITSKTNRSRPDPAVHHTLPASTCPPHLALPWAVRRLTPEECEALQGFPRGYTAIPYRNRMAADGPRYKALGNSMAVNVMEWIGQRIEMVDDIQV